MMQIELGKSVELVTKGTTPTSLGENFTESGIKFLRAQNVVDGKILIDDDILFIDNETHNSKLKRSHILKGDVLLTIAGTIGRTAIVEIDEELNCNQAVAIIRLGNSEIHPNFLCHFFATSNAQSQFTMGKVTATIPNLSLSQIKKLKIPLPPLDQQKKIAAILDAADAYRQKTKALIEKYDELTQSLFLEMFGDPVSNSKKLPKIKLGKLGKWQSGGTPSRSNSAYYDGEIPWLSSGELNQMYISDSKEHITEQAIKESNTKLIAKGSILLGMYDTAALKSTINTEVVSCNQAIAYCKLDDRLVNTSFVYNIIQIGKEYYRRLQRGVRQKNLNLSMVKGIEILFPPIKLQNQFAERVQAIEAQKAQAQAGLAQSEDLFNSLLQRAFKGELS
jgi:type I restriction enzyme, S subunit